MKNKHPIRIGIFETNSSSSHSFSLGPRGRLADTIESDERGVIKITTDLWEFFGPKFNDPKAKLSYLLCFAVTVLEPDEYKKCIDNISKVVEDFTGASWIDITIETNSYIDHQSTHIINDRDLDDPEFIKEFVFNPSTWVYTIWDSFEPSEDFYEDKKDQPVLYTIHFILPGIEEDVSLPVKYGDEIEFTSEELLERYYWSGERFYDKTKDNIESWYEPYKGGWTFGDKELDFYITL